MESVRSENTQTLTATPERLDAPPFRPRAKYRPYLALIVVILGIYSSPALRTALTTRSLRLPSVSAPDLGLYLSITQVPISAGRQILNPYYHIPVPYPVSYLKFRLGPILFGLLNNVLAGRIWLTLFLWNLLCWCFLCVARLSPTAPFHIPCEITSG